MFKQKYGSPAWVDYNVKEELLILYFWSRFLSGLARKRAVGGLRHWSKVNERNLTNFRVQTPVIYVFCERIISAMGVVTSRTVGTYLIALTTLPGY